MKIPLTSVHCKLHTHKSTQYQLYIYTTITRTYPELHDVLVVHSAVQLDFAGGGPLWVRVDRQNASVRVVCVCNISICTYASAVLVMQRSRMGCIWVP